MYMKISKTTIVLLIRYIWFKISSNHQNRGSKVLRSNDFFFKFWVFYSSFNPEFSEDFRHGNNSSVTSKLLSLPSFKKYGVLLFYCSLVCSLLDLGMKAFFPIFVQLLHSSGSFQMYIQYSIMYSMSKWGLAFALIRIWAQLFIHFCCFWPFMTTTSDSFHHIFFWHYQQLNRY